MADKIKLIYKSQRIALKAWERDSWSNKLL